MLRTIIKIYLQIMVFLTNLINFHWIFTCRLQKSDFSNFSNFCIFAARCKKNYCKPFGLWIFIFIRSKDRASLPRKWFAMISIVLNISIWVLWKTNRNYISASNRKFCPKGAIRQRRKESASHHFATLLKIIWK